MFVFGIGDSRYSFVGSHDARLGCGAFILRTLLCVLIFGCRTVMHEGTESAYRWSIYVPIVSLDKNLLCLVEDVVIQAVQECVWVDVLVW